MSNSTAAKDGGAGKTKWTLPPPSKDYRDAYDSIFKKKTEEQLTLDYTLPETTDLLANQAE